jgi:hypothetical protein
LTISGLDTDGPAYATEPHDRAAATSVALITAEKRASFMVVLLAGRHGRDWRDAGFGVA